jgi:tRNA-dihydrouridine synthase B
VSLDGIRAVVNAVERIPVVGNGDVRTIADAARMFSKTGCTAISIGRGALSNPWIFCQLHAWETTGALLAAPTFDQRLRFMERHFHLLVAQRGERFACLTFRKVVNWYCRALRVERAVQQCLIRLESVQVFHDVVGRLRALGERSEYQRVDSGTEFTIPVPAGPVDRW